MSTGEEEQKASGLETNRGPEDVLMSHSVRSVCVHVRVHVCVHVCVHSTSTRAVVSRAS